MTAQEMNDLKSKIKSLCSKRGGFGSLSSFSGSSYNFSTTPVDGGIIRAEHGQKTIDIALEIEDIDGLHLAKKEIPKSVLLS